MSLVAPKIAHFDFGEVAANFEDSVSVNCLVSSGDLPLDIEWMFNDYPINHYSGISTSKMGKRLSVLMIDAVSARHVGNYTCKARNLWASAVYTAQLTVNGTCLRSQTFCTALQCRSGLFSFYLYTHSCFSHTQYAYTDCMFALAFVSWLL